MKLLVASEGHYVRHGGTVYSGHLTYDRFWKRYLSVFDSVLPLCRVRRVGEVPEGWRPAGGENVDFIELPDYRGPWQYLRARGRVGAAVGAGIEACDAFLLRSPGTISTVLWRRLRGLGLPFGVEVVGDPWEVFAPGVVRSPLRAVMRRWYSRAMKAQCRQAVAVAYVTAETLQRRYPPGGWTTHYSSVHLDEEDFASGEQVAARAQGYLARPADRPWRCTHIGSMAQHYKGHAVLLEAFAACIRGGLSAELDLIGDGPLRGELVGLTRALGLAGHVRFRGCLPGGDPIRAALDEADLFLLPSLTEGLPRVVIEAMARGLPCIASDVGGVGELLEAADMFPPGDADALAAAILQVLSEPSRLARMAARGLEVAREYRADVLTGRRIELYRELRRRSGR